MRIPSTWRSSELRQLLFIGFSAITAVALSYNYVMTEGLSDMLFAILGASLLLTLVVTLPTLLLD
ncbi:hypothetical protein ELS20_01005 [Haloarcula hispanica]|uniref:Uncharacterized protein n=1 Tax=Haloarcula hispanica TaxID=51589 RepID=A0A482TG03_HALHI|nr:hypothetical protein ELS20_01005 [Haloarcula hispanica]